MARKTNNPSLPHDLNTIVNNDTKTITFYVPDTVNTNEELIFSSSVSYKKNSVTIDDGDEYTLQPGATNLNSNFTLTIEYGEGDGSGKATYSVIIEHWTEPAEVTNAEWLVMVYMAASNNLEPFAVIDMEEIIAGTAASDNANLYVIVLMDRIEGYSSASFGDGDWTDSGLYLITKDGMKPLNGYTYKGVSYALPNTVDGHQTANVADGGDEVNMGDPQVLEDFIKYSQSFIQADKNALVLWNHGGGVRGSSDSTTSTETVKMVCGDDETETYLYTNEIQEALTAAGISSTNKLDSIGFDACLMGMAEEAYEYRDLALTMTGSMANEWGYGWDYERLLSGLTTNAKDAAGYATLAVQQYQDYTSGEIDQTQAAYDLTTMESLKTKIDALAAAMAGKDKKAELETLISGIQSYDSTTSYAYRDLALLADAIADDTTNDFSPTLKNAATAVTTQLDTTIIASYAGSAYGSYSITDDSHRGLSLLVPTGTNYDYTWWYTSAARTAMGGQAMGSLDFCTFDDDDTVETWRELFEYWYDEGTTKTPDTY